jgi:type VI secretion system protein ImpB
MPLVRVIRKGVTAAVRKVPTSTCAAVMPMTLDRVGREAKSEDEEPTRVDSAADAFDKFKPGLKFDGKAGENETEFRAEFQFRSIKDFDPENLQKRQEVRNEDGEVTYLRNDIADLKNNIDLLYRLKDRWKLPAVRRAWSRPEQREEIIGALGKLRTELEKVAKGGKA